jgi:hypothetical protein
MIDIIDNHKNSVVNDKRRYKKKTQGISAKKQKGKHDALLEQSITAAIENKYYDDETPVVVDDADDELNRIPQQEQLRPASIEIREEEEYDDVDKADDSNNLQFCEEIESLKE